MSSISLDAAIALTGLSKRTLWRRLSDGRIGRVGNDGRGRTMLDLDDLLSLSNIKVDPLDYELFGRADAGDPAASNDLALVFLEANKPEIAFYWLQMAVNNKPSTCCVDAMHNLATLYIAGRGISKDENSGMMWLAKAAAHGHIIAKQQMAALTKGTGLSCG